MNLRKRTNYIVKLAHQHNYNNTEKENYSSSSEYDDSVKDADFIPNKNKKKGKFYWTNILEY